MNTKAPLLEITNLGTEFPVRSGSIKAVDDLTISLDENEILGIVGESGSGKSITAFSIMRLLPPPGRVVEGKVLFKERDLLQLPLRKMRKDVRGAQISMIFQEPMSALNPLLTIGRQISEAIRAHQRVGAKESRQRVYEILNQVGIPEPKARYHEYPHQLSGGQRQRIMIAIALACRPSLLIADEPTTALDVTCQAQILDLIKTLQEENQTSVLFISHDLGVIAEFAQRIAVMYAGTLMESADVVRLFDQPAHPYTRALMRAIPYIKGKRSNQRLNEIPGMIPSLLNPPPGCKFHPRCQRAEPICSKDEPPFRQIEEGHWAKCWFV